MTRNRSFAKPASRKLRLESLEHRRVLAGEPLIISEFMATNLETLQDRFRQASDWVEIYNPTEQEVSLNGWFLTDNPETLNLWQIPDVSIPALESLVIFASGRDRTSVGRELHTNFRLSSEGEYLALVRPDMTIAHDYADAYPEQQTDISYGVVFTDDGPDPNVHQFFSAATPGAVNVSGVTGFASDVGFSVDRGFFDEPFSVALSTNTLGGTIRYTTDGSEPTDDSPIFDAPIAISETTTLRAASFRDDLLPGEVGTHTYIFLDDVLQQTGEGLPEEWGFYDDTYTGPPARAPANYEMDPDVVNDPDYADTIRDDLRSIPTVSIVLDPDALFDHETGIYSNTEERGDEWTPRMSMEWIDTDGDTVFQANAGIRIHGGWARRPFQNRKYSFRAVFQGKFGEPTLNYPVFGEDGQQEFTGIVLRGGFNDQWRNGDSSNTYTQDQWARAAHRDVGGFAPRDNYVHLYLNGLYWGVYSPTERPDATWAASYQGGEPDEYDVVNTGGNLVDGDLSAWNDLIRSLSPRNFDYEAVSEIVDMQSFADYLIVNQYIGNWDWPHNNWYASRRRVEGGKWQFHTWDAEAAFQRGVGENRVDVDIRDEVGPARLYIRVREVPEFQEMFAERAQKQLFGDGALSVENNVARLTEIASQIDRAIVGESARWGDNWLNTARNATTRDRNWAPRIEQINERYFPDRGERLIQQYRDGDLFPLVDAPLFDPAGGKAGPETQIGITTTFGDIYYTIDGSDPRTPDGQVSSSAIRFNTYDLLTPSDATKLLAPTGDPSESGWQELAFDDSSWTDGTGALGFDTGLIEDLISVPNGFTVLAYQSTERLNSFVEVELVLAGENRDGEQTLEVPYINFFEGTRERANFQENNFVYPFGGTADDPANNIVLDITGTMDIRVAGTYTLGVSSNDAARLSVDGELLYADEDRHSSQDTLITLELTQGEHDVHLTAFERTGTAGLEFFYAPGEKTEFDETFQLVGDLTHRPFGDRIDTDVSALVEGKPSIYVRAPFTASELDKIEALQLRTLNDAGMVVSLNGTEVYRQLAPETVSFDSTATGSIPDRDAVAVQVIDISESMEMLAEGPNVLTFHLLNESADDFDLLLNAQLTAVRKSPSFRLSESTTVQARTLDAESWSTTSRAAFGLSPDASVESFRINEIHYHPPEPTPSEFEAGLDDPDDFEFVELTNISDQPIDLRNARLVRTGTDDEGVAFDFAAGEILELLPGGFVLVVEDREAFQTRYGAGLPVAGEWIGGLGNGGETVSLVTGDGGFQQLRYDDSWHAITDGGGPSLERIDATADAADSAAAWRPSFALGGTPGRSDASAPGDANRDGVFDTADLLLAIQSGHFEDGIAGNSAWEHGDWNGDGEFNTADLVLAFISTPYQGQQPQAAVAHVFDDTEFVHSLGNRGGRLDAIESSGKFVPAGEELRASRWA